MSQREVVLFDHSHDNPVAGTTRIEAVVCHSPTFGGYSLRVRPYSIPFADDPGLRRYPVSAGHLHPLPGKRFSQKTLDAFAHDPETLTLARKLAGLE